jgi:hypothetical protein
MAGARHEASLSTRSLARVVTPASHQIGHAWERGDLEVCFGPNHPVATLRAAIDDLAPALVWIGVSYAPDAGRLVDQYAEVYEAARARRSASLGWPATG